MLRRTCRATALALCALALSLVGCPAAVSPYALAPDEVDAALAEREDLFGVPETRRDAATEAGYIALLYRSDLDLAHTWFARALDAGAGPLARLGAAISAHQGGDPTAAFESWSVLARLGTPDVRRLAAQRIGDLLDLAPGLPERALPVLEEALAEAHGSVLLDVSRLEQMVRRRLDGSPQGAPVGAICAVTVLGPVPGATARDFRRPLDELRALGLRRREVSARDGRLIVHPHDSGLFLVEAPAPAAGGAMTLRTETRASIRVLVAGTTGAPRLVLERDAFAGAPARLRDTEVELPPGGRIFVVIDADRPAQTLSMQLVPSVDEEPGPALPAVVAAWVRASLLERAGDADAARAELAPLLAVAPDFAPAHALLAQVAVADPLLPRDIATADARAMLEQALSPCPNLVSARALLARLLSEAGASDQARELLLEGRALQPDFLRWDVLLADLERQAGWESDAEEQLRAVLARHPGCCAARKILADLVWDRPPVLERLLQEHPGPGARERTEELPLRDALRRGDGGKAAELAKAALLASPDDETALQSLVKALLVADRPGEARALLAERVERYPDHAPTVFQQAEAAALAGDTSEAQRLWRDMVSRGGGDADLRHRLALLGFGELWSRFVLDGRTLAEDFRTLPSEAGAAAVWLLDDSITIYYPDGGAAHRTHVLVKLLTEGAAAEAGEVTIPPGAEVLEVRTLKADGAILEPEDIVEKDTVSLPNLEVGDFIEVAMVRFEDPDARFAPGRPGDSFLFGSFDGPVRRSRFVVIAPEGQELVSAVTGDAVRTLPEVALPGYRAYGWEATYQPQATREPLALQPTSALPQVHVALSTTWEDVRRAYFEQEARRLQRNRSLHDFVRRAVGKKRGDLARARAIFYAVQQEIALNDDRGLLLDPAAYVLARESGERVMLLRAALEDAGIPARILLVHPLDRESGRDPVVPNLLRYTYPVVAAEVDGRTVWLDVSYEYVPFDYLAPTLQGRPALDVERPGSGEAVSGTYPIERELRELRERVVLGEDGTLTGRGQETLRGIAAISYRSYLANVEPDRQREVLGTLLKSSWPSATLLSLELTALGDPSRPLELEYTFVSPATDPSRPTPREITFSVAPEGLARSFVALGERSTPFLFNAHYRVDAQVTVVLRSGVVPMELPEDVHIDDALTRYDLRLERAEEDGHPSVIAHKQWTMPMRIIPPGWYEQFKALAARIDRADRVRIPLTRLKSLGRSGTSRPAAVAGAALGRISVGEDAEHDGDLVRRDDPVRRALEAEVELRGRAAVQVDGVAAAQPRLGGRAPQDLGELGEHQGPLGHDQ